MYYKRKPRKEDIIKAIQFTGENTKEVIDFIGKNGDATYIENGEFRFIKFDSGFTNVVSYYRIKFCHLNDWIVDNLDGTMTSMTNDKFLDFYELKKV